MGKGSGKSSLTKSLAKTSKQEVAQAPGGAGGVLPYITYTGMCCPKGRDFEAPDLERGIHFRGVF